MKIEIKSRYTGRTLIRHECDGNTLAITVAEAARKGADLRRADLRGADLRGADFSEANLRGAYLLGADLRGAYLLGADLRGANLSEADLRRADLSGADLSGADLSGADLSGADLSGADLSGAVGNGCEVISVQLGKYPVVITHDTLQIGCQRHSMPEWKAFTDAEIAKMDEPDSLAWWRRWKGFVFLAIEMSKQTEQN